MRIWHQDLIPKLCTKHLVACWREALGAYKIITEGKRGYSNHPATKEFAECPEALYKRLKLLHKEATKRGYHFKDVPPLVKFGGQVREWQSLSEQVDRIKEKKCNCKIADGVC